MPPSSSLRSRSSAHMSSSSTSHSTPSPRKHKIAETTSSSNTTNIDSTTLGSASENVGESASSTEASADAEADKMDVHTPSGGLVQADPRAGNPSTPQPKTETVDDLRNYDLDGDMSDADSPNGSDIELDDDYGDIDKMSEASDLSDGSSDSHVSGGTRLREREYEQELQDLEDRGAIDWDDDWSYQYNPGFSCADYDICGEDGAMKSTHDMATRQNSLILSSDADYHLPMFGASTPFQTRRSNDSDWEDSSDSAPSTPVTPNATPALGDLLTPRTSSLSSSNDPMYDEDEMGDETEDDEDYRTAPPRPEVAETIEEVADELPKSKSPPKSKSKVKARKPVYRILDENTPVKPKKAPKPAKKYRLIIEKNRPYCFTVETIGGGYHFEWVFPKGSERPGAKVHGTLSASLRRSESISAFHADSPLESEGSSDSGRDSPTYIDWEDAVLQGNTNTGASITDTIRGRIFAQTHCRPRTDSHVLHAVPSFFDRILSLSSQNAAAWTPSSDVLDMDMEGALDFDELIDLDECAESSSEDISPMAQLAMLGDPIAQYPYGFSGAYGLAGTDQFAIDDSMAMQMPAMNGPASTGLPFPNGDQSTSHQISPSTPTTQSQPLAPPFSPLSPRKRRFSDRSDSGVRPLPQKRNRASKSYGSPLVQCHAALNEPDMMGPSSLDAISPTLMDTT